MNTVLSVNCVFVSALHRLYGPTFFASILQKSFSNFEESYKEKNYSALKNTLNCFLHFYLFQSITAELLLDIIKILLQSFNEGDIELLIFMLHNIGL